MADTVNYDVEGYDVLTSSLMTLLNTYPALSGRTFRFSMLDANSGLAMFPVSGAIIQSENRDILGHVTQICLYPFYIVYRVGSLNADRKLNVKEWLDNLGRWLEKQPIKVGEEIVQLSAYPTLTNPSGLKRKITTIKRTSPATQSQLNENNTEDWAISITAHYLNEY